MTIQELKEDIYKKIEKIEDEDRLATVIDVLDYSSEDNFDLKDWELDRIKEAKRQVDKGDSYSHEQVKEIIGQWRKE